MKNTIKQIGFLSVIIAVIGSAIGAGIFFKNGSIINNTQGNIGLAISCWVIAFIGILAIGLALIEVVSIQEKDKGILGWVEKFSNKFIFKWSKGYMLLLYLPTTFVTIPLYAVMSLQDATGWTIHWWLVLIIAFSLFLWISLISFLSVKMGANLQWIFTIVKFLPIVLIPIFGFINIDSNSVTPTNKSINGLTGVSPYLGVLASIPAIFFAYDGFYAVSSIKKDMKKPKLLPLAMTIGIGIITTLYLLVTSGVLVGSKHGNTNVFENIVFKKVINLCIFLAVLGIVNGFAMGSYNIYDEYIEENNFVFAKTIKKWKTSNIKIGKSKIRGITPGFTILFILTLVFFIFFAFLFSLGYSNTGGYSYSDSYANNIYSFTDLITNWSSVLVFVIIVFSIIGALINRKTNKIRVQRSRLFIPSAIIAIIFTLLPMLYMIITPIVDITGFNHADKISAITTFCVLVGTIVISIIPWTIELIIIFWKNRKKIRNNK